MEKNLEISGNMRYYLSSKKTILETRFGIFYRKWSGKTQRGAMCQVEKLLEKKTCCTSGHQNHQCPNGNSSIDRWFYMIFTYFPIKSTQKKKHVNPIISSRFPLIFLSLDVPISFPCQCSFPSRNHGSGSRIEGSRLHLRATPLSQGNHMWGGWIQDDWGVIIHS